MSRYESGDPEADFEQQINEVAKKPEWPWVVGYVLILVIISYGAFRIAEVYNLLNVAP